VKKVEECVLNRRGGANRNAMQTVEGKLVTILERHPSLMSLVCVFGCLKDSISTRFDINPPKFPVIR